MSQWKPVALSDVCQIEPPKKEVKAELTDTDLVSFVPMKDLGICAKKIELNEEKQLRKVYGGYTYFAEGDVLLAKITPCFENGKLGIARGLINGVGFGSSEYIVFRPTDELDPEYLFYFLSRESFRVAGAKVMTGAVGHKRVPKDFIENQQIPLPPLPEQKRIVVILDEAFVGISQAITNAEKNLANARELFENYLNKVFTQKDEGWIDTRIEKHIKFIDYRGRTPKKTSRGMRLITAKNVKMGSLQLEPQEFVDPGSYKEWMTRGIPKKGDVLFTTEAPLGNVAQLDTDEKVVFAQRIIIMQPDRAVLDSSFLKYMLLSNSLQRRIHEKATGATAQGIKASLLKKVEISFPESKKEQESIVERLDTILTETMRLETIYQQKLTALAELKQSILQKVLAGELTSATPVSSVEVAGVETTSPEFTANILAVAYHRHVARKRDKTFGHVKAQKILHLVESIGGIDLGRKPVKDAAGPNDFKHMLRAEESAEASGFFKFIKRGNGYEFVKLGNFDKMISGALLSIRPYRKQLERIIDLLIPMDSKKAEVLATVHAAWNELVHNGEELDEDRIIYEARYNWHPDKQRIPESKFREAIRFIRDKGLVPDGKAKRLCGQERLL